MSDKVKTTLVAFHATADEIVIIDELCERLDQTRAKIAKRLMLDKAKEVIQKLPKPEEVPNTPLP